MINRRPILIIVLAVLLSATSCGGALYKVKPAIELPPLADNLKRVSAGGVALRASPLLSDEDNQDLFEANLPLSAVLAVRVEMVFESGVAVEMKRARFRLRDSDAKEWKLISAKDAISLVLKANEVYVYNPNSRKQFEKEFAAYALDLKSPLSESDRRREGFLFFRTPKKEPVASPQGLVLSIDGLPQRVEIPLN
ncbi:MAG TPA: hypothetical protein VNO50_16725 [Pyrinomonadaceae bacterium]|nr:hypothetical protein [Pyrinomonadaceae bacterium]